MNMTQMESALRGLRLSGMLETLSTRAMQAQTSQEPFLETFAALLQDELDRRRSRLMDRRYKRSGLDERAKWQEARQQVKDFHHRLCMSHEKIQSVIGLG